MTTTMITKYFVKCPKCAEIRSKKHLKTCSVIDFPTGQSFKCFHCGYKEFNRDRDVSILKEEHETAPTPEAIEIPNGELPVEDPQITYHTYYRDSKPVMYVARRGSGNEKWIRPFILTEEGWMMSDTKGPFLYRSEHLHDDGRKVLVVEGEKAADAASKIFTKLDVVSWKGGVANIKAGDWGLIKHRSIVLWPDNDEVGVKAMQELATIIDSKDISIVDTKELPAKFDLADEIDLSIIADLWRNKRIKVDKPTIRGVVDSNIAGWFNNVEEGLSLGWKELDKIIKLPNHGLVIIPGRTNHGKSLFQINVMANLLRQTECACIYLSYEMPNEDILLRLIKTLNGTAYEDIGYKDDLAYKERIRDKSIPEVDEVNKYIATDRLFITDADISLSEIDETVRYLHALKKKIVVFLDYVQLVPSSGGRSERYLEVKNTVEKFRQLSNELKFVVIGGSQLTAGETPYQDQARESKDISFTAALILKIWNKESARVTGTYKMVKDPDNPREKIEEDYYDGTPGTFIVEIIKSRQGSLGATVGFNTTNGCKLVEAEFKNKGGF